MISHLPAINGIERNRDYLAAVSELAEKRAASTGLISEAVAAGAVAIYVDEVLAGEGGTLSQMSHLQYAARLLGLISNNGQEAAESLRSMARRLVDEVDRDDERGEGIIATYIDEPSPEPRAADPRSLP